MEQQKGNKKISKKNLLKLQRYLDEQSVPKHVEDVDANKQKKKVK